MARRVTNTKHFKISKLLSEKLRRMSPGEPLPTVEDLKEEYGCSQVTITQAIDRLRLQGLVEKPNGRKRLVVAHTGARSKFQVTLIRPLWSSPDFESITNRLYEMGHEEHFGFGVYIYSDVKELNIEHALKQYDAGLIIGTLGMSPEQIHAVNGARKPIVFLRNKPESVRAGSVWVDDAAVGQIATRHLLDLGHRRIAVMLSEPYNPSSSARMQGWRNSLLKAGLSEMQDLVADCSVQHGRDAMSGSYERFHYWLNSRPLDFTAVFCIGWTGALAVLRALRERNIRVPEDVSIITYATESPLCNFTEPPLTTVQVDLDQYTRQVIRLVEENLAGETPHVVTKQISLKPHVAIRGSTAQPPSTVAAKPKRSRRAA